MLSNLSFFACSAEKVKCKGKKTGQVVEFPTW